MRPHQGDRATEEGGEKLQLASQETPRQVVYQVSLLLIRTTDIFSNISIFQAMFDAEGMDDWCRENCAKGNCPEKLCTCPIY